MMLSLMSICFNLVGLVMYNMCQSPTFYNALFIALYAAVIIALADRRGGSNVGMVGHTGVHPRRRGNDYTVDGTNNKGDTKV